MNPPRRHLPTYAPAPSIPTASEVRSIRRAVRRGELAAARWLAVEGPRRLGIARLIRVLRIYGRAKLASEPFGRVATGTFEGDIRDVLSRRQCGDAVLLDRAVVEATGDRALALEFVREIVLAAAPAFLDAILPMVEPDELSALAPKLTRSFFNADGEVSIDAGGLDYKVSRCRFVELLAQAQASHLAPIFCEADDHYFRGGRLPVRMLRSQTLARGGTRCDFRFEPR